MIISLVAHCTKREECIDQAPERSGHLSLAERQRNQRDGTVGGVVYRRTAAIVCLSAGTSGACVGANLLRFQGLRPGLAACGLALRRCFSPVLGLRRRSIRRSGRARVRARGREGERARGREGERARWREGERERGREGERARATKLEKETVRETDKDKDKKN